jgi:hypothetical protein
VSVNAELTHPVDKAGPTAGPGATVETGKLNRSLESKAFSESSFTTEAGRSTTSPAATCWATRGSSTAT